jgi:hypothetical protein
MVAIKGMSGRATRDRKDNLYLYAFNNVFAIDEQGTDHQERTQNAPII